MSVKDDYLAFRNTQRLRTSSFDDRVKLQHFIKGRLPEIWQGKPKFKNGGLLSNYMTRFAVGFAYYDCRPTKFCRGRCYGLPLSDMYDYFMLRLGVITSEAFKNGDKGFISLVERKVRELNLKCLKIGHWGDVVLEQVPHIVGMVNRLQETVAWWYTRKREIAIAVNEYGLPNLRAYLSLDPASEYPDKKEYPFGITYLLGDGQMHRDHDDILLDERLVAVFLLKKGKFIENPEDYPGVAYHPKLCIEKEKLSDSGRKTDEICLECVGRCNYMSEIENGLKQTHFT